MKNVEFLYHLIKSMDKRDKDNLFRYARVRGKKTDHKYLDLFRAIDEQATYNEKKLRAEFQFSNFSEAKKHLMSLVLKTLRIYDEHPETEMQNRLAEIRILLDRSLEHLAMKKIQKAREVGIREERFAALLELADYELKALPFVAKSGTLELEKKRVVEFRESVREKLDLIQDLQNIQDRDLAKVMGASSRSGKFAPEAVQALESNSLLARPDSELPVRAQSTKYRIWNVVRHQQLDFERRAEVLEKLLGIFEAHPFLIREEPVRYIYAAGGYCLCLNVVGRYGDALAATLKLLELPALNDKVRLSSFVNISMNLSIYTFNTGDTVPFSERETYLLSGLRVHRPHMPGATLTYIRYLFSMAFWLAGDLRRANRFAKRVLEEPFGRMNIQAACRCFLLIFAYEQDDPEQIMKYARTWRRQWKKKEAIFQVEQRFTEFMVRLLDYPDWLSRSKAVAEFSKELEAMLSGGFRVRADNFILVNHWLDASQSGRKILEVIREKAKGKKENRHPVDQDGGSSVT